VVIQAAKTLCGTFSSRASVEQGQDTRIQPAGDVGELEAWAAGFIVDEAPNEPAQERRRVVVNCPQPNGDFVQAREPELFPDPVPDIAADLWPVARFSLHSPNRTPAVLDACLPGSVPDQEAGQAGELIEFLGASSISAQKLSGMAPGPGRMFQAQPSHSVQYECPSFCLAIWDRCRTRKQDQQVNSSSA